MSDMTIDHFAEQSFGKAALAIIGDVSKNFRLYKAGWLGNKPKDWKIMAVTGAEFRVAKSGKHVGKLSVKVPSTDVTVYVTIEDMEKFEAAE